jgi:CRISPR/Cas system endoribonuclease Cas6 (RAMP superfamily)
LYGLIVEFQSCGHESHVFKVFTVASECKPERILKDAKINITSFMCFVFSSGERITGWVRLGVEEKEEHTTL